VSRTAENPRDSFIKSLRHQKKIIPLIVSAVAIALVLSLFIIIPMLDPTAHLHLPSIGTIRTVGVKAYYDPNLQNITTQIQWGETYPGSTNNITIYIKSTSNIQTKLDLQTGNWTFLNSTNAVVSGPDNTTPYLNLTWNYNNATINPGQAIPVTLTLSVTDSPTFTQFLVNSNVVCFSFDIVISAAEQTG
jgi:hypothetical protein